MFSSSLATVIYFEGSESSRTEENLFPLSFSRGHGLIVELRLLGSPFFCKARVRWAFSVAIDVISMGNLSFATRERACEPSDRDYEYDRDNYDVESMKLKKRIDVASFRTFVLVFFSLSTVLVASMYFFLPPR